MIDILKLKHSITGEVRDYYVDNDELKTEVTNTSISYISESNGEHHQSGIPYLGQNNVVTKSYRTQIKSGVNFLNSEVE